MRPELRAAVQTYIGVELPEFHARRLRSLQHLKLDDVLRRKNPYLFRAKNLTTAGDLVRAIVDAFVSSREEGIFGTFLEGLARVACSASHGGAKSSAEGIDLEFLRDGVRYLVAVKSGPNWGNSQQIARLADNFRKAKRILGTNARKQPIECINGCCYGKENRDAGDYQKVCGQRFWELITGDDRFYIDIIEPIGDEARAQTPEIEAAYVATLNRFTKDFLDRFCLPNGAIDWEKIVRHNSQAVGTHKEE